MFWEVRSWGWTSTKRSWLAYRSNSRWLVLWSTGPRFILCLLVSFWNQEVPGPTMEPKQISPQAHTASELGGRAG